MTDLLSKLTVDGVEIVGELRLQTAEEVNAAFVAQWPNYCRGCDGWGGAQFGGTYWEPPDFDPCEAMPTDAHCHRCSKVGLTDCAEGPCSVCGWDYDDGLVDTDDFEPEPQSVTFHYITADDPQRVPDELVEGVVRVLAASYGLTEQQMRQRMLEVLTDE